jgi:hypothetical protein
MEPRHSYSATSHLKVHSDNYMSNSRFQRAHGSGYFSSIPSSAYGQRAKMTPDLMASTAFFEKSSADFKMRTDSSLKTSAMQQAIEIQKQTLNKIESENRFLMTKLNNYHTLAKKLEIIKKKMYDFPNSDEKIKRKMLKVL